MIYFINYVIFLFKHLNLGNCMDVNSGKPATVIWDNPNVDFKVKKIKSVIKTEEKKADDPISSKNMNLHIQAALASASTMAELAPLVKNANEHISLSGYRYIFVKGYKGKLPLDALASRITEIVGENFEFSKEEIKFGKKLADRILKIYENNVERTKELNVFTRLLCKIRDLFSYSEDTRTDLIQRELWMGNDPEGSEIFKYYSKDQYIKKFGEEPQGKGNIFTVLKVFGKYAVGKGSWKRHDCPPRWPAPKIVSVK